MVNVRISSKQDVYNTPYFVWPDGFIPLKEVKWTIFNTGSAEWINMTHERTAIIEGVFDHESNYKKEIIPTDIATNLKIDLAKTKNEVAELTEYDKKGDKIFFWFKIISQNEIPGIVKENIQEKKVFDSN